MPQIQIFKNHPCPSLLRMAPKYRLDCQPEIGIFPVDIEADLELVLFVIEADLVELNLISAILKPI